MDRFELQDPFAHSWVHPLWTADSAARYAPALQRAGLTATPARLARVRDAADVAGADLTSELDRTLARLTPLVLSAPASLGRILTAAELARRNLAPRGYP